MKKLLLNKVVLLACAVLPLGWTGARLVDQYRQAASVGTAGLADEASPAAELRAELAAVPDDVGYRFTAQNQEVLERLVNATPEAIAADATRTPFEAVVAKAVGGHSELLGDTVELLSPTDVETNPFGTGHPYAAVFDQRVAAVAKEREIRALVRDRPEEVEQIRALLEEYRALPGADASFYDVQSAEVAGYAARVLDAVELDALIGQYLDDRTTDTERGELRNRVSRRIDVLSAYLAKYEDVGTYGAWARDELGRWKIVLDFLRKHDDLGRLPIAARVASFAALVEADRSPGVRDVARRSVRALCGVYLPERLPLDDKLYVLRTEDDPDAADLVDRDDVVVVWEDRRMDWFNEAGFDEFAVPADRVRRLVVDGIGTRPPLLRGTPASIAAHRYNTARADLEWTLADVDRLHEACVPHAEYLGETWSRIEALQAAVHDHAALFAATATDDDPEGGK